MRSIRPAVLLALSAATLLHAAAAIPADRRVSVVIAETLSAPVADSMHMPTDVVVDSRGIVYVADGVNDRVVVFGANGKFDRAISSVEKQKLSNPVGLAMDAGDRLWIADNGNHRVLVLRPDGALDQTIDLPPAGEHAFDVTDVAVTADDKTAYIIDNDNHRVAIRDNAGGGLRFAGRFGESLGQLRWPFMVAVGADGYAYISEAIGARVQRLSADDRWAGQIGQWGVEMGQLYRPKGVVVSPRGHILIGDSTTGVVQMFNPRGGLLAVLTDPDGKPWHFAHPMGMAFDRAGRLYVVELKANRVAIVVLPPAWAVAPGTGPAGGK